MADGSSGSSFFSDSQNISILSRMGQSLDDDVSPMDTYYAIELERKLAEARVNYLIPDTVPDSIILDALTLPNPTGLMIAISNLFERIGTRSVKSQDGIRTEITVSQPDKIFASTLINLVKELKRAQGFTSLSKKTIDFIIAQINYRRSFLTDKFQYTMNASEADYMRSQWNILMGIITDYLRNPESQISLDEFEI